MYSKLLSNLYALDGDRDFINVRVNDNELALYFPFHKEANDKIKRVEGSEYQTQDKAWIIPINETTIEGLEGLVFDLEDLLEKKKLQKEIDEKHCEDIAAQVCESLQADYDHDKIHLDYQDGYISLSFPYQPKVIRQIKKITGKQWVSEEKIWLLPADKEKQIRSVLRVLLKSL